MRDIVFKVNSAIELLKDPSGFTESDITLIKEELSDVKKILDAFFDEKLSMSDECILINNKTIDKVKIKYESVDISRENDNICVMFITDPETNDADLIWSFLKECIGDKPTMSLKMVIDKR